MQYFKTNRGFLDLFAACMLLWSCGLVLDCLDDDNMRLESFAMVKGGIATRSEQAPAWCPVAIPRCFLTDWLYPVVQLNLSNCNVDDEEMQFVCRNSSQLNLLRIDNNPGISDAAVPLIEQLSSMGLVSTSGTSITKPIVFSANVDERDHTATLLLIVILLACVLYLFHAVRSSIRMEQQMADNNRDHVKPPTSPIIPNLH